MQLVPFEYNIGSIQDDFLEWMERHRKADYLFLIDEAIGFAYVRPLAKLWVVDVGHIAVLISKVEAPASQDLLISRVIYRVNDCVVHELIHTCDILHAPNTLDFQDIEDGIEVNQSIYYSVVRKLISS